MGRRSIYNVGVSLVECCIAELFVGRRLQRIDVLPDHVSGGNSTIGDACKGSEIEPVG